VTGRLRAHAADARGFTVVELLVTMTLGLLVIGSSVAVLTTALRSNDSVQRRTEALQNGRIAIDQAVRLLRSQVCPDPIATPLVTPVAAGGPTSITFFADLGDGTGIPRKHVLSLSGGVLRDDVYLGSRTGTNPPTWSSTVSSSRVLGTGLAQDGTTPVFQYFGYTSAATPAPTAALGPTLDPADLEKVARIVVTVKANPSSKTGSTRQAVTVQDEVFVRLVNPNGTAPVAVCT
jgi:type II secretory pathway pseudopilin PulG